VEWGFATPPKAGAAPGLAKLKLGVDCVDPLGDDDADALTKENFGAGIPKLGVDCVDPLGDDDADALTKENFGAGIPMPADDDAPAVELVKLSLGAWNASEPTRSVPTPPTPPAGYYTNGGRGGPAYRRRRSERSERATRACAGRFGGREGGRPRRRRGRESGATASTGSWDELRRGGACCCPAGLRRRLPLDLRRKRLCARPEWPAIMPCQRDGRYTQAHAHVHAHVHAHAHARAHTGIVHAHRAGSVATATKSSPAPPPGWRAASPSARTAAPSAPGPAPPCPPSCPPRYPPAASAPRLSVCHTALGGMEAPCSWGSHTIMIRTRTATGILLGFYPCHLRLLS
jgi:hypothetical protein